MSRKPVGTRAPDLRHPGRSGWRRSALNGWIREFWPHGTGGARPGGRRGRVADLLLLGDASGTPAPRPLSASEVEALVRENLPLVGYIARETASRLPRHLDTDDLAGAVVLALVQAAQAFDVILGVPFARFANSR